MRRNKKKSGATFVGTEEVFIIIFIRWLISWMIERTPISKNKKSVKHNSDAVNHRFQQIIGRNIIKIKLLD